MVIADTDILIDALERGREVERTQIAELLRTGEIATTAITVYELTAGARTPRVVLERTRAALAAIPVLPVSRDAAAIASAANRYLASRGQAIATPDMLIAGICLESGLPLLTRNVAHFSRVPGLALVSLSPGG